MHPPEVKQEALRLVAEGLNDCEIGRRLGIPRSTVRDWRAPRYVKTHEVESCHRCWRATKPIRFAIEDYSELLAMYLGDGCLSPGARTCRLRISLDNKYPNIIDDARGLLRRCFPENSVDVVPFHDGACVNVSRLQQPSPCLFPQHAPGTKHQRRIALEEWQLALLDRRALALHPWLHSDGWMRIRQPNRTVRVSELRVREHVSRHREPAGVRAQMRWGRVPIDFRIEARDTSVAHQPT